MEAYQIMGLNELMNNPSGSKAFLCLTQLNMNNSPCILKRNRFTNISIQKENIQRNKHFDTTKIGLVVLKIIYDSFKI